MRFQSWSILYVLTFSLSLHSDATIQVYFKTLIPNQGFVFGKSIANIDSKNKLTVKFQQFNADFQHSMHISILASKEDGKARKKQR
jgi:hypothetical protein